MPDYISRTDLNALRTELRADIAAVPSKTQGMSNMVPATLAFLITGGFVASTIVLLFGKWDPATVNSPVVVTMLTGMGTMSVGIMGYFFGATQGGKEKDATIAQASKDLAASDATLGQANKDLATADATAAQTNKNLASSDKTIVEANKNLVSSNETIVQANEALASSSISAP